MININTVDNFENFKIIKWDCLNDGILDFENMEKKIKSFGFRSYRFSLCPGRHFPFHSYSYVKADGIVTGYMIIYINDSCYILKPGDIIFYKQNLKHGYKTIGIAQVNFVGGYI